MELLISSRKKEKGRGFDHDKTVMTDMLVNNYTENKAAYDQMTLEEQEEFKSIIGEDLGPGFEQSAVLVGLAMNNVEDDQFEGMRENMDTFLDKVIPKYAKE